MTKDDDARLSGTLQENIVAVLCFDGKFAAMARHSLTIQHFESAVWKEIAGKAIDYIDQFKTPIGDHLLDEFEGVLTGQDDRKAANYRKHLENLFALKDSINGEYVIAQLHKFVRGQTIKSTVLKVVEAMEDGRIEDAEVEMQKGLSMTSVAFEPGIELTDPKQALSFLDIEEQVFTWGVPALEKFRVGPERGTLMLLNGAMGRGKSWGLIHIGKHALLQRLNIVHVTLEMSDKKTVKRYLQSMFAMTQEESDVRIARFKRGNDGSFQDVDIDVMRPRSLTDADTKDWLDKQIVRRLARKGRFKVKQFPSGSLTMPMLRAYLDGLERFEGFIPDMLVIDYAELMSIADGDKRRGAIGKLFVDLRGLGVERNCAVVTASQVNRSGIGKTTTDETDLAEDISKGFTVDTMVTYNQTAPEKELGLARLYVAKNRDGSDRMTALITQSYASGQWCLDSMRQDADYSAREASKTHDTPEEDRPLRPRKARP